MTQIWVPLVASVIGGVLGIAASLIVFSLGKRRAEKEARHEAKRVAVSRMLDVLDEAIKVQVLPPLIRHWRNPNASLLLALSRLMLDLPKEEIPVALWAASQVQRMAYERAGKQYLRRATQLQTRLISWYRGEASIESFSEALQTEPFREDWTPSPSVRVKTELRDAAENIWLLAAAIFAYTTVKETLLPLASRLARHQFDAITK